MNSELKLLNNPRLGSFGEFLVATYFQDNGHKVQVVHKDNVDLLIDGVPFDVKATKAYLDKDVSTQSIPRYKSYRKEGVQYIYVIPHNKSVLIAQDGTTIYQFPTDKAVELYNKWKVSKSARKFQTAAIDRTFIKSVAQKITEVCGKHGLKVRILHRNGIRNQHNFGKYGPKNLIPKNNNKEDATICVWTEGNTIHKIIAFRHSDIGKLPLYQHTVGFTKNFLTLPLHKFPLNYSFDSIEDFEQRFFN